MAICKHERIKGDHHGRYILHRDGSYRSTIIFPNGVRPDALYDVDDAHATDRGIALFLATLQRYIYEAKA